MRLYILCNHKPDEKRRMSYWKDLKKIQEKLCFLLGDEFSDDDFIVPTLEDTDKHKYYITLKCTKNKTKEEIILGLEQFAFERMLGLKYFFQENDMEFYPETYFVYETHKQNIPNNQDIKKDCIIVYQKMKEMAKYDDEFTFLFSPYLTHRDNKRINSLDYIIDCLVEYGKQQNSQ